MARGRVILVSFDLMIHLSCVFFLGWFLSVGLLVFFKVKHPEFLET